MQPKQPKITQKQLLRTAIGIFALAGLFVAYRWYKERESDPTVGKTSVTAGWVAAIETVGDDKRVVVFKEDGTIIRQTNAPAGFEDRDVAWRPDGNCVFFSSNREKEKFTMFRWFPSDDVPKMRSVPSLAQGAPFFLRGDADKHDDATGLVTVAGNVMEYDPKRPRLILRLPPPDPKEQGVEGAEGGGKVSPFEGIYQQFGTSFRMAKWTPDKKAIVAVMRREIGEILIYQKLEFSTPEEGRPAAVIAGDRIDFHIDEQTSRLYYSVQNFQWPSPEQAPEQFRKGAKLTVPYRHGVGMIDINAGTPPKMIMQSQNDKDCFGNIAVSPSGDKIAVVYGSYEGSGNMTPKALVLQLLAKGQEGRGGRAVEGAVFEPSWSPDGKLLIFALREGQERPIYTWNSETLETKRLSTEKGVFGFPVFSPQMK